MFRKLSKSLAAAALIALACVSSFPSRTVTAEAAVSDWFKGVSIVPRWNTDFTSDDFKQSVKNAQAMGANSITLIIPYMQDNYDASNIYQTGNTPSDETLSSAIDFIHSLGMKVVLKPHLEVPGGGWRASIDSHDRNAWYASYSSMLNHLGDIGKAHNVEMIVTGTELIGMASPYSNPDNTQRWVTMINSLRTHYPGLLTYSANWGKGINYTNEFEQIAFWSSLDYIGVSAYFELQSDASVSGMKGAWQTIDQSQIQPLQARYGKPVIFSEIGYRSIDNAHYRPWDYEIGGNYNGQEQVNTYDALIQYWNDKSYFKGVMIWDWNSNPNYGGQGNTDFTPRNKPAEGTLKYWFTQNAPIPTPTPTTTPTTTPNPNPNPTPTPAPTGTWNAAASTPSGSQIGASKPFQVTVMSSGQSQDVISDVEIYDPSNAKVFQKFYDHQNITQSVPGQYSVSFVPSVNGTHRLKVGVFSNSWGTNYYWNDNVLPFSVGSSNPTPTPTPTTTPNPTPQPTSYVTNIWWPTDGVAVSGVQPFKAMLEGKSVSEYEMYWQVDNGALIQMSNSSADYPHKESLVDLSAWKWRGEGPYPLNFVSKDASGNVISQKSISIYVR